MEKTILIDGKETKMVANGATPRLYRAIFKKDIFGDMGRAISDDGEIKDSEVFENLAFTMAKQGGFDGDIDSWLAGMSSPMAVIEAIPAVLDLWMNTSTETATAKKN